MKERLLKFLLCPACTKEFTLQAHERDGDEIISGILKCRCSEEYRIINGIPRFVRSDEYVGSFSFEWMVHRQTQLDSYNIALTSENQMRNRLDFELSSLKGKLVLDAGCGAGRYAEVAAKYDAEVICVDLSYAVESAYKNIGKLKNIHIIQADIFKLPLRPAIFHLVYSYGVLHHTPDARAAFYSIVKFVRPQGAISIFVYSSYNKAIVHTTAFWRIFTTRMPKRLLYYLSFISVPLYFIYKIPIIGNIGKMIFVIPMLKDWRWRVLDTLDWYSPKFQSKHTHWEVFNWFRDNGIDNIKLYPNEITMSGIKNIPEPTVIISSSIKEQNI